uniref:cyclic nucleotide-binding domain-containing protein n=1 Tax=Cohnella rhizosphaerae TaxID=1457232 RepID=UPI003B8A8998
MIVHGNVELTSVTAAGLEATLGVLGAGEVCGATSALDESASTVSAHALLGDVRALGLQREALTRLVRLYPDIGLGLLRASLARVRLLEEMLMRIDS